MGKSDALAATGMLIQYKIKLLIISTKENTHNPESNPTCPDVLVNCSFLHGSAKLDCVAVWFFAINWNVTVSPACAVIFSGL